MPSIRIEYGPGGLHVGDFGLKAYAENVAREYEAGLDQYLVLSCGAMIDEILTMVVAGRIVATDITLYMHDGQVAELNKYCVFIVQDASSQWGWRHLNYDWPANCDNASNRTQYSMNLRRAENAAKEESHAG